MNLQTQIGDTLHHQGRARSYARSRKGGAVPHESAMALEALILKAAFRLLSECLYLFQTETSFPPDVMQSKLTLRDGGTEEKRFNNQNRLCIYVVRMLSDEKIYIATTSYILKKYSCG